MRAFLVAILSLSAFAHAQQIGTQTAEVPPKLCLHTCTKSGGCTGSLNSVTIDANWRQFHAVNGKEKCLADSGSWDPKLCPDGVSCGKNCALEGMRYAEDLGVTSTQEALTLRLVTNSTLGRNVGSRLYMLDHAGKYVMFKLNNQEFTFDVDVSELPCAVNGALYFSEMHADGDASPSNKAGARFGTGYCDAQCPKAVKFVGGKVNLEGWKSSGAGMGTGNLGACCTEMDIWEANKMSQAFTAHSCNTTGPTLCEGALCDSLMEKDGCDFASYRLGAHDYYGPGKVIDTTKKFSVITQFLTKDGKPTGELVEIRRLYVQNGRVIKNSKAMLPSLKPFDSITTEFCTDEKKLFNATNVFQEHGGLARMGAAMERGMVLTFSLWDDASDSNMQWLDGTTGPASQPGASRGSCAPKDGNVTEIEATRPHTSVTFSNIRVGEIDSTYKLGEPAAVGGKR